MGEKLASFLAVRALLAPAGMFIIGVGLSADRPGWAAALALGLLGVWLLLRERPGGFLALLLAFAASGAALAGWRLRPGEVPEGLDEGAEAVLEGELEATSPHSARLAVDRLGRAPGQALEPARFRAQLSGVPADLLTGERVRVLARLFRARPPSNPGEADLAERDRQAGVDRRAVVRPGELLRLMPAPAWARLAARARAHFDRAAEAAIADARARALVEALAVGDRSGLDAETNDRFGASGLAHILSVSGLHVAVVALGLLAALRWLLGRSERLALRGAATRLSGLLSLPALWAYVLLTGAEVPAVRSGIMASALVVARCLGREPEGYSALAASALLVLAYDPAQLHDLSFQLSFGAVLGLLALASPLRALVPVAPPEPGERRWWPRLREAALTGACTSLAAALATGPIVAATFHRESLVSVAANVVALPLATALTGVCAMAAALSFSGALLGLLLKLAAPLAGLLLYLADAFAALPFAQVRVAAPAPTTVLAYYALLLALPLLAESARARRVALGSALALGLLGAWRTARPRLDRELEVTFLSVGQGDATFVRFPGGATLLIDGGGEVGGHRDLGAEVLGPFLWERGVDRLDAVALSHPHPDHALGLIALAGRVGAGELWEAEGTAPGGLLGELEQAYRAPVRRLAAGDALERGGVRVEVLGPPRDVRFEKVNDQSLVLRLSYGEISILLPGDAEAEAEQALLASGVDLRADVLKAPHHGSPTSSSAALLDRVRPRYAVFCVGHRNRFGFPAPEVEARYAARECQRYRTDRDGAVTFRTDGRALEAEPFLARPGNGP